MNASSKGHSRSHSQANCHSWTTNQLGIIRPTQQQPQHTKYKDDKHNKKKREKIAMKSTKSTPSKQVKKIRSRKESRE